MVQGSQRIIAKLSLNPARVPFFYGWFILGLGTLGVLMSVPGQTIGVSTFTDNLIQALGITRDQLSLAYMCGTLLSASLLTRAGKLYDRFGVRPIAIFASLGLGIALLYLSLADDIIALLSPGNGPASIWIIFPVMLFGFMAIRFCGQGVLTLSSKTMMMKWFDRKRGFAMGFANVFIALGFSLAPILFEELIQTFGWKGAWQTIAIVLLFIFPIIIFLFFRNDPREHGLIPDGNWLTAKNQDKPNRFVFIRDFTLGETRRSFTFWVFASILAMQGLYITGFTFHVVSIFEQVGFTRSDAVAIFQPVAIVAVVSTLIFSTWSDYVHLKWILIIKGIASSLGIFGLIFLGYGPWAYYLLILGNGIMTGLYGVISSVAWPRFFGKQHLGAIVGQVMTLTVFGSALGPVIFSFSLSQTGAYSLAAWSNFLAFLIIAICGFWTINPQEKVSNP